jgi:hypothetical protein
VDSVGLLVRDLNAEFLLLYQRLSGEESRKAANLFNSHDHFDGVETIKTEVVVEVRLGVELSIMSASCLSIPPRK